MTPSNEHNAFVIGLVGGIGAGKSAVAAAFEEMGAQRIDADEVAHDVLQLPAVKRRLKKLYGKSIIDKCGRVSRPALAQRAFRSSATIRELEAVVHPIVIQRIRKRIAAADGVVVLDAPLVLECGLDELCDLLIYVKVPARVRRARLRRERNWDDREVRRRERLQLPVATKARRANICVENDGTPARTRARVRTIWKGICKKTCAA